MGAYLSAAAGPESATMAAASASRRPVLLSIEFPLTFENSRRKVCPNSGFEDRCTVPANRGVGASYAKILRSHSEANLNFRPGGARENSLQESGLRGAFAAEGKRDTRRAGGCSPARNIFQGLFQFPFRFLH